METTERNVLILVLMEDTLRVLKEAEYEIEEVLILVLMEDTLRAINQYCSQS